MFPGPAGGTPVGRRLQKRGTISRTQIGFRIAGVPQDAVFRPHTRGRDRRICPRQIENFVRNRSVLRPCTDRTDRRPNADRSGQEGDPVTTRHDGRDADELRPVTIQRGFVQTAAASVLIQAGQTMVLCTASVEQSVPGWRRPQDDNAPVPGWVTAEYSMLPGSTTPRKPRDRKRVDGRTTEIQRLIGRSLRAVVDFEALGERTIVIDCDVLQADGGTRTLSITGGFLALCEAVLTLETPRPVLKDSVAAVSAGVVEGRPVLDLDYAEDSSADVDMNVIMTGSGRFIEVQGTAEGEPFDEAVLQELLRLGRSGIQQLSERQRESFGNSWPLK